jgi:adenosylhomocysteine nucleosidase
VFQIGLGRIEGSTADHDEDRMLEKSLHRLFCGQSGRSRSIALLALWLAFAWILPAAADPLDPTPRTAIMSAFEPEWLALRKSLEGAQERVIGGTVYASGSIAGKPVLLFYSGMSMVNAAMAAQRALDAYKVERLVFSGIAGGVDPALQIGDVVVPEAWSQYLEAIFARETDGTYKLPPFAEPSVANFGMIFPQPIRVPKGHDKPERVTWFRVDPALLDIARKVSSQAQLAQCSENACFESEFGKCARKRACLNHQPQLIVGGNGVSGQAFVDNKAFREYVSATFKASVLDMESAAVAHVAYANDTPFIAFRSLSDLAGGGPGENEIATFFQLASDNSAAIVLAFVKALP